MGMGNPVEVLALAHCAKRTNNFPMPETNPSPQQIIERRAGIDPTLFALLTKNHEMHQQAMEKLLEMSATLHAHITQENAAMAAAVAEGVKAALAQAFPNGDAAAHRMGHEEEIEQKNERKKTRRVLAVEILKWLATAFVLWAGYALWGAFLKGPSP